METTFNEERHFGDYRLQYTVTTADEGLRRLELCVLNTELEHEEEMRIYGYVSFEHDTYTCNLSSEVDIISILNIFNDFLAKMRTAYSTARQ